MTIRKGRKIIAGNGAASLASVQNPGLVQPDGETIIVNEAGVITAVGGGSEGGINFTPMAPLAFKTSTSDNIYNGIYNAETGVYNASVAGIVFTSNGENSYKLNSGGSLSLNGALHSNNYIDLPYNINDVLSITGNSSNTARVFFGYKNESGEFIPVLTTQIGYVHCYFAKGNYKLYGADYMGYQSISYTLYTSTVDPVKDHEHMYQIFFDAIAGTYHFLHNQTTTSVCLYNLNNEHIIELNKINTLRITKDKVGSVTLSLHQGLSSMLGFGANYDEIIALPKTALPEYTSSTVLVDNSYNMNYNDLSNIPMINGKQIKENLKVSDLNVQQALTPKQGLKIEKQAEWKALNGEYNVNTKQFDLGSECSFTSFGTSLNLSSVSTLGENSNVIPKAGVVLPFYKNITYVPYGTNSTYVNYNKLFIGIWDGVNFRPKFWLNNINGNYAYTLFGDITKISNISLTNPAGSKSEVKVDSEYGQTPCFGTSINYDSGYYTFRWSTGSASDRRISTYIATESENAALNECNAIWLIGNGMNPIGDGVATKLVQGDIVDELVLGIKDGSEYPAILPDTESMYTEIKLNIDENTIKVNEDGQIYADVKNDVDTSNLVTLDTDQEITARKTFKNANCGVQIANNVVDIGDTNFGAGIAFQSNASPTEFSIVGRGFSGNSLTFKYFDGGINFNNNINFKGSIYDKEGVEIKGGGADLTNYYTKEEIDTQIGDINAILDEINGEEI